MALFRTLRALAILALTAVTTSASIRYSTVTGYFLQDNSSTSDTSFEYTAVNFGLINKSYNNCPPSNLTQWQQFTIEVSRLNAISPARIEYKVLFLGRHGEGDHNTAESYYGTPAWNCYYSLLDGNTSSTWTDAHLTNIGIKQALTANAFWKHQLVVQKMQAPQSYYTSPLYRCLQTAHYTFSNLTVPSNRPFTPTIKELLREGISQHTCDHRSNRTFIHESFPTYRIEANFTEHDELWTGLYSETQSGQDARSKSVLGDIFSHDSATWISITSHSGEIASLLRVLGHRVFHLNTGAVIPVLVKAETVVATSSSTEMGPTRVPSAYCTSPPLTSISGDGCVCQGHVKPTTGLLATRAPFVREL